MGRKRDGCEDDHLRVLISNTEPAPFASDSADNNQQSSKLLKKRNNTIQEPGKNSHRRHALFPPPGFRSRNIVHMITAVIGYLFILCVAVNMEGLLDTVFFTIASLSVVDICTNWTGAYARLAGLKSSNTPVRVIMKIVWSMVIFTAWIVIMAILQEFLSI